MLRLFNRPPATPSPRPRHPQPQARAHVEPLESRRMLSTTVTTLTMQDQSASATFLSVDNGIETFVDVQGAWTALNDGSGAVVTHLAFVTINVWDNNTSSLLFRASGDSANFTLNIDANLKSARLLADDLPIRDHVSQTPLLADVDLTWTATSKVATSASSGTTTDGPTRSVFHVMGRVAEAVATGTVMIGSTNYTPEPSIIGFIQHNSSREQTITKGSTAAKDLFSQTPVLN